jgi:hypothetical protein
LPIVHTEATTPAGSELGRGLEIEYLNHARIQDLASFAIEAAIAEEEWLGDGRADRNSLLDKFHLISALPYVDEIVSDDRFFWKIYPAAQKSGHVKARLIMNQEFLGRFRPMTPKLGFCFGSLQDVRASLPLYRAGKFPLRSRPSKKLFTNGLHIVDV